MAIQIPTLNRIQKADQASVGQVSTQVADTSAPQQVINKAVSGFGEAAMKYVDQQEQNAATLAGTKAGLDFGAKYKGELRRLKGMKGDPTEPYAKLDEDSTTWENEVLGQYEGASERTKQAVRENILKTRWQLQDDRQTSQALQRQVYDKETTNASVSLKKDNALGSIETLNAATPEDFRSSLIPFQLQLNGIRDDRVAEAKRNGLIRTDEFGNITYEDPQFKEQYRKDVSETIENSVKTLNAVGKTAEAKALMEEYSEQLTAKTRADLAKGTKESGDDNQAYLIASKYQNMPLDVALSRIAALPGDTGEQLKIKDKAMAHVETFAKRMDQAKKMRSEQSREQLAKYIDKSRPIDVNELENDEIYKRLKGTLSSKDDEAIRQKIEQPKSSDLTVKAKVFDMAFSGELTGMRVDELDSHMVGLSKADRVVVERSWRNANDETNGEKNAATRYMGTTLKMQMQEAGIIKVNAYGKYSNNDQVKYTRAQTRLIDKIDSLPKNTSMADQNRIVQQFVQDELKSGVFDVNAPLPAQQKIKSAPPVPRKDLEVNTPPPAPRSITPDEQAKFRADFKAKNGRTWTATRADDVAAYMAFKTGKK